MISKWDWLLKQFSRTLWVRALLYSLLAIVTALVAIWIDPYIPADFGGRIGADAVDQILDIMASSMLAVTTFSLTVMVSAYSAATSSVTPRATRLLMQDTTTQNVLSTFLGAFLFSLVGIVGLNAGAYGDGGRVLLFVVSLAMILIVALTLLRWISHLTHFGRVGNTTERVEKAAHAALEYWVEHPCLGANPLTNLSVIPDTAQTLPAWKVAYVEHIDTQKLSECACEWGVKVYVLAAPGSFVNPSTPLAKIEGSLTDEQRGILQGAFSLDAERSFDQDPRYGMCVLAEIASRALSPAMNDPGTAIDVLSRSVRILSCWEQHADGHSDARHKRAGKEGKPLCENVWMPPLDPQDVFNDFFTPIARDGAGMIEVQVRLQKVLSHLAELQPDTLGEAARDHARLALERVMQVLNLETDRRNLTDLSNRLFPPR
ncbi:MAG: hypothetical protein CML18_09260 [Pusillimonas sp.]|nr:hypothetical protein [Pusillimonas sp.]